MARKFTDEDLDLANKTETVELPATGSVSKEDLYDKVIEVERAPANALGDKAAALAFMEEKLDVMVHESADPNAVPIVETYCNGVAQRFIRGQVQSVKRKYVEILATAKETGIATREAFRNGDMSMDIVKHTALKYPFSVVHDPNPKGAAWLKSVMSRP
jgi:hypothetical protein